MEIHIILDIIVIAFLVIGFIIGAKKGLIHQILSLTSFIISFIVAKFASKALAAWGYANFIKEKLELMVTEKITSAIPEEYLTYLTEDKLSESINELLTNIPEFMRGMIKLEEIDLSLISLESITELSTTIVSVILAPVIIILLSHILFIILFIILTIIFKIIIKVTNIVKKIPVIKTANKYMGAMFGLIISMIVLIVIVQAFSLLMTLNGTGSLFGITEEIIESTKLFKLLVNIL